MVEDNAETRAGSRRIEPGSKVPNGRDLVGTTADTPGEERSEVADAGVKTEGVKTEVVKPEVVKPEVVKPDAAAKTEDRFETGTGDGVKDAAASVAKKDRPAGSDSNHVRANPSDGKPSGGKPSGGKPSGGNSARGETKPSSPPASSRGASPSPEARAVPRPAPAREDGTTERAQTPGSNQSAVKQSVGDPGRTATPSSASASPRAAAAAPTTSAAPEARAVARPDTVRDDAVERAAADDPTQGVRAIAFVVQRPQPYVTPGRSATNHWRLITLIALLGMLTGVALGYLKAPTYTAETRLVVGKTAQLSNLASVPGLDAAGQSLASSYSRLVTTDEVLSGVAKRLGGSIDGSLSASPIPLSPLIRVEASASSPEQAAKIANAGSRELVDAVNKLNEDQSKSADALLTQYAEVDRKLLVAQAQLDSLKLSLQGVTGAALDTIQKQVNNVQSQVDTLKVQLDALSSTYGGVYNPTAINTQVVQRVGDAAPTGSNRSRMMQLGGLVGLVGGALIGLGLAVWLDLHARKRA